MANEPPPSRAALHRKAGAVNRTGGDGGDGSNGDDDGGGGDGDDACACSGACTSACIESFEPTLSAGRTWLSFESWASSCTRLSPVGYAKTTTLAALWRHHEGCERAIQAG